MYRGEASHTRRFALVVFIMAFVVAVSACGGGGGGDNDSAQQQSKERTLPNLSGRLPAGKYSSEEFKPPLSLTLGKGWALSNPELPDAFDIARAGSMRTAGRGTTSSLGISFFNVREVFDYPSQALVPAPHDMAAWLQKHPDLNAAEPVPTKVAGVPAVRIDTERPSDDVVLFRLSNGDEWGASPKDKFRFIVVENVKGETVTIAVGGPAGKYEELLPRAQEVLETVKWEGGA
jgi:hypothetical protein